MPSTVAQLVSLTGADAIAFAHAQFASRVNALGTGHWQFSAWLDAKGRVRALFHLARVADDHLLLLLRGGDASALVEQLQRFVFRSKVAMTAQSSTSLATGPAVPAHESRQAGDSIFFGCGDHSMRIDPMQSGDDDWRVAQLRNGWVWLPSTALDAWLPPALSLQRLQAVVTDKGCYPGQEIIARMHFLGGHKRHLHHALLSSPVPCNTSLRTSNGDIGCVLNVITTAGVTEALVVLTDLSAAIAVERRLDVQTYGRLDVQDEKLTLTLERAWPA